MAAKMNVITAALLAALEHSQKVVEHAIVHGQTWVYTMDDDDEFILKFDRSEVSGYWLKLLCGYRDAGSEELYDAFYIHVSLAPKTLITVFDRLVNPDGTPSEHLQSKDFGSIIWVLSHFEQNPDQFNAMLEKVKDAEHKKREYEQRRARLVVVTNPNKDQ